MLKAMSETHAHALAPTLSQHFKHYKENPKI